MPMVEGVGDEVIQVLGICLVILIFVTAWKSTAIRELPQIRAVYILDRRSHNIGNNDASNAQSLTTPPDPGPTSENSTAESTPNASEHQVTNKPSSQCPNNEVNAFRLSYFSNLQNQSQTPSTSTASPSQTGDYSNVLENAQTTDSATSTNEPEESQHPIRVKLKYLNDEQRIVTGDLKEQLGQFKRRYFQVELSNNKHVLLIFQGRVLREEESLETIGMYDNCVVHCLIKAGRPASERTEHSPGLPNSVIGTNLQPADWNLGPVLLATLVAIFSLAWFSHWTYPQLFGITSTVLLATLTTLFILALASIYYPNLFQSF